MAEKKILGAVQLSGRRFLPGNERDAEDLDKFLSPEDAKRLTEKGVISGMKGTKQEAEQDEDPELTQALRARRLTEPSEEGPARPQGIEYDKDGEPQREPLKASALEQSQAKAKAPKGAAQQPWDNAKKEAEK